MEYLICAVVKITFIAEVVGCLSSFDCFSFIQGSSVCKEYL